MIVHYSYVECVSIDPAKTNSPLPVDPDRVLSRPISLENLQTIARRHGQVFKRPRRIQQEKLSSYGSFEAGKAAHPFVVEQGARVFVGKAPYHARKYSLVRLFRQTE